MAGRWGCEAANYEKLSDLGSGTYGVVVLAKAKDREEYFAIKRIKRIVGEEPDIPRDAVREIAVMRACSHENVMPLLDAFVSRKNKCVHLVMPMMQSDLTLILEKNILLTGPQMRNYAAQILRGLDAMHSLGFVHRDLKPGNILVKFDPLTRKSTLVLTDFGLCRTVPLDPRTKPMSPQAVTVWYRPPELLFAAWAYSFAVDLWSFGCVFAEILTSKALFPGNTELDVLSRIIDLRGSPSEKVWPGYSSLPGCLGEPANPIPARPLSKVFPSVGADALSLLDQLLSYNPAARGSAADILRKHKYFNSPEGMCKDEELPVPPLYGPVQKLFEEKGLIVPEEEDEKLTESEIRARAASALDYANFKDIVLAKFEAPTPK